MLEYTCFISRLGGSVWVAEFLMEMKRKEGWVGSILSVASVTSVPGEAPISIQPSPFNPVPPVPPKTTPYTQHTQRREQTGWITQYSGPKAHSGMRLSILQPHYLVVVVL
jgi:hypothetical protein